MHEDVAQARARDVSRALNGFLERLAADVPAETFEHLMFGKQTLAGAEIGYKPEAYTRLNLIEPLLQAVGLEYQLEPRSSGVQRDHWPDFELTSPAIPYIGEVKPLHDVDSGRDEIRTYLGIDGFDSPYGLCTDGVEWLVFGPPADGGQESGAVVRKRVSLDDALKSVALTEGHWDNDLVAASIRAAGIDQIEAFPRAFDADELDTWALEKMPPAYRADFLTKHESLQASLDGVWE